MGKLGRKATSILLILLMIAPILNVIPVYSQGQNNNDLGWMSKFHPVLLSKVLAGDISDEDEVTVFFRLKPLPTYTKYYVKGNHDAAVTALKQWAKNLQPLFIKEVYKHGGMVLNTYWIDNLVLVRAKLSVIKELAKDPLVVEVFENFKVEALGAIRKESVEPSQEVSSWGIFKIGAPDAWAMGYTGEGIRIAILDTGVDITHPALQGKMLTIDPTSPYYPGGWMEFDDNGTPVLSSPHDTHGHGTHTSGTALGGDTENILIGVAPGATLMHGLVLPGGSGTFAQVLAGIEWAVDPYYIDPDTQNPVPTGLPAHVISMSLGADGYYGNELLPGIENALLANIVVVAAIGNAGQGTSSNPGNIWGVFGVGATDQNDDIAYFSSGEVVNWPDPPSDWPFYDTYPSTYIKPDFSAPGVQITSSVPGGGYESWDGTSMATPHVAGTVALILQASLWYETQPDDLPERVYEILKNTSVDLGDPGQDTEYGWGRINASAAVQLAEEYAGNTGVQGAVLDAVDMSPVKWANITVVELNKTYHVRPDGTFKIILDPGTYNLLFTAWGYQDLNLTVEVIAGNGTIAGYVYDSLTLAPIAGALVTIVELGITTMTDSNGTFQVTVPAGTYTLNVTKEGYYPYETRINVQENETVIINIPLNPVGSGTVEGYVYDALNMTPISDAYVIIDNNANYSAITNSDGYFIIENVPAGWHNVTAYATGYIANTTQVAVLPNSTVNVTIYLFPVGPSVVVVVGDEYGYLTTLLNESLPFNVVYYANADDLINDWLSNNVTPAVIVLDHWYVNESDPSWETVYSLLYLVNTTGTPILFLDTPYAGTTGMKALYYYYDDVVAAGFLAPAHYTYGFPSPEYIKIYMLNPDSPFFNGVNPVNDSWFYLADINRSDYADYLVFMNWSDNVTWLANLSDEYEGVEEGALGLWWSPGGSLWIIMSSWAESEWMNYIEPGGDGVYSNNTARVLINAVLYAMNASSPGAIPPKSLSHILSLMHHEPEIKPDRFTNVTVYMQRLPYGYVEGSVYGSDGVPLSDATIIVEGTPVKVSTDENGTFRFWLPAGNYTLLFEARGYKSATLNVTISVNQTTNVGKVILVRLPRVAILYDYAGELKQLIEERLGWYVEDYSDISLFAEALMSGFFDAGIWAGYYFAPFPNETEFYEVWNAINETGVSIIFLDQWDSPYYPDIFGYGIRALNYYLGDPANRYSDDYFGDIYIKVEKNHPILRGYEPGQMIKIINYNTQGYGTDYSVFSGYSGDTLATLYLGGSEEAGDSIAYKILDNGAKIILMASWAPEEYQNMSWWTEDMKNIFINAVIWAAGKPLNVTPSQVSAHVGDTVTFSISGAPANYTIDVYLDSTLINNITTDQNGNATFTLKVPTIPGGEHALMFQSRDFVYSGSAKLIVLASLDVAPETIIVPGSLLFNATGLPADSLIHIFVDSNYLGTAHSTVNGTLTGVLNLPFLSDGSHEIILKSSDYKIIVSTNVTTNSSLAIANEMINASLETLMNMIQNNTASIEEIVRDEAGNVIAVVNTTKGDIDVKLADIKTLINASTQDLAELIQSVNGSIRGLIVSKSGDIYVLVDNRTSNILVKLDDLNTKINNMQSNIQGALNTINSKLDTIQSTLSSNLSTLSQETSSAKTRSTASLGIGGVALALAIVGVLIGFRASRVEA